MKVPCPPKKSKPQFINVFPGASVKDLPPGVAEIVNIPWIDKIYMKPVCKQTWSCDKAYYHIIKS